MQVEDIRDGDADGFVFRVHKNMKPGLTMRPGGKGRLPRNFAHLMLSDLLMPVLAQYRFHLILDPKFELLQAVFF